MTQDSMEKIFKWVLSPYVLSLCPSKYIPHNILLHLQQTQRADNICNLFTLLSSLRLIMVASNTAFSLRAEELFKPFGKDSPELACGGAPAETREITPHGPRSPAQSREGPPGGGGDHFP